MSEPVRITKPTPEDIEAARESPFYKGYQTGRARALDEAIAAVEALRYWRMTEDSGLRKSAVIDALTRLRDGA